MKILSTVIRNYYGEPNSLDLMYLAFTLPLQKLGHQVDHFDHVSLVGQIGPEACGERFARTVRQGGYDVVLYQTGGRDHMVRDAIRDAARNAPVIAWNSDDDWQWESYSQHLAPYFTYMVTTYPHVYEAHRTAFPNLLLSQWACLDTYTDAGRKKDLNFTFAGQVYRNRVPELRELRQEAGLKIFGYGASRVWCPPMNNRRFREAVGKLFPRLNRPLEFHQVNEIWNRTKVSYTPMSASVNPQMLQIKSRAFEMGLSGTLMLCQTHPALHRYYEPGREFVQFHDLKDCVERAQFYLRNDRARLRIAEAYRKRTLAEHMWEHRWLALFQEIGLGKAARKVA
ncbi:MAG TPA: glycosyltransferase [Tepidisphaeraceae bacterium]|jgi:spore maturation protein CgeB|nr:glycosyltransferase [Tepidisphaeraceae bacterium]